MSPIETFLRAAVALLAAGVFAVGIVAYARRPTARMLLVVGLFALFLLQGALLVGGIFLGESEIASDIYLGFQLLEVLVVALVVLKR